MAKSWFFASRPISATKKPNKVASDGIDVVALAHGFLDAMNRQDFAAFMEKIAKNCVIEFPDAATMNFDEFRQEMENCFASFPDTRFSYSPAKVVQPGKMAIISKLSVSGTHTGKPYGFGPYPEIEAKGIKVQNDPERMTVTANENGEISLVLFEPLGEMTGPPGFYTQIGGFPI